MRCSSQLVVSHLIHQMEVIGSDRVSGTYAANQGDCSIAVSTLRTLHSSGVLLEHSIAADSDTAELERKRKRTLKK